MSTVNIQNPLVYIWGEGETEIVALHGFLNLKVALRLLFGIVDVCFKRGVVSDVTPVFSNSIKWAFPLSFTYMLPAYNQEVYD